MLPRNSLSVSIINKCRICLKSQSGSQMNSFFNVYFEDMSLAQVFANITSYEVQEDDMLPKNICGECKNNIVIFNNMISTFQETEIYLLKRISDNEIKEEIEEFEEDDFKEPLDQNDIDEDDNDNLTTYITTEDEDIAIIKEIRTNSKNNVTQNTKSQSTISSGSLDYKITMSCKYTCQCGDCFLHKSGFRQHMQYKHNKLLEGKDFEKYAEEFELKVPVGFPNNVEYVPSKVIIRKNKLQCRICSVSFLTEQEVKTHEEIHKTFICDHCGSAFLKKHYLSDHLRIHSEERRYTCKLCQKSFKHRFTYSVHKRCHEVARDYVCDTCGASFKSLETLRTHMRLKHSNIRNYSCPNCNLTFNLKSTLNKHILRKHTPNRTRFVCSKCGASYLNKTTLTRHEEEKHLGKLKYHACTICENKVFVMKKTLKAHMLKKHSIVPE